MSTIFSPSIIFFHFFLFSLAFFADNLAMKKSSQFSIKIPSWMDAIISEMAENQEVSKNTIINELLRAKLADLGFSQADVLIEKLRNHTHQVNNQDQLLG